MKNVTKIRSHQKICNNNNNDNYYNIIWYFIMIFYNNAWKKVEWNKTEKTDTLTDRKRWRLNREIMRLITCYFFCIVRQVFKQDVANFRICQICLEIACPKWVVFRFQIILRMSVKCMPCRYLKMIQWLEEVHHSNKIKLI